MEWGAQLKQTKADVLNAERGEDSGFAVLASAQTAHGRVARCSGSGKQMDLLAEEQTERGAPSADATQPWHRPSVRITAYPLDSVSLQAPRLPPEENQSDK
ncbi:hypothetical protein EYF80_029823 [Liparis tanakae]|uniref:Uncharacterized protein n=1 Tax=Liparis tanakae TaxID=230148 RepID=A0A4Z2H306_9TELE|nr:hypothetical protein EYF80_029823 [Liparis tanakae]